MVSEKKNNDVAAMEKILKQFQSKNRSKVNLYNLILKNTVDKEFIDKYQLSTAPLPLLLTMAPDEVLTGGFPGKVTLEEIEQSTGISQLILDIMKSMQERKIALVCFQNNSTQFNKESSEAVNDFQKKEGFEDIIDVIKADPHDSENMDFLKQVNLKKNMKEAAVVFMMPPGRIVNTFTGKITKADLEACLSSCTGGDSCCPAPQP